MVSLVASDMKSKLLSVDDVYKQLQSTEPVSEVALNSEKKIKFKYEPDWAGSIDALDGMAPVAAFMTVGDTEYQLTKQGAIQACTNFGLTAAYIKKVPAHFTENQLNYWYSSGMGLTKYNALMVNGHIAAFMKPTLVPYSNVELLERVLTSIYGYYGDETEVYADTKLEHSIVQTHVRLIVPETARSIKDGGAIDVPEGEKDLWSAGIQLSNSLIGDSQTMVSAYLFRWWCTNGATEVSDAGRWNRRAGEDEDVFDWAEQAVDEVLDGMENRFKQVQALTQLDVESKVTDVVREIFERYNVPAQQRSSITTALQKTANDADDVTMYTVMNAITQAANEEGLAEHRVDTLMRIGGDLPTATFDPLKAKVWAEGHTAEPDAPNPYQIPEPVLVDA